MEENKSLSFDQLPSAVGELLTKVNTMMTRLDDIGQRIGNAPSENDHVLMDIREASTFVRKKVSSLYAYTSERRIPFYKRGNTLYFFKDQLIKWIEVNIAYTLSYFVSFCCNFIITSYWTFHSKPSWKRLTGFGGSHIINYFVQLGFLNFYLWLGVTKEWAALLAMGSAVPINFALLHFVYKNKK